MTDRFFDAFVLSTAAFPRKLNFPTNCAFGGAGLQDLYFANLEGEHFSRVHTTFHGHPLYHQR